MALDLHSADGPQIVWYYSNAPSTATGILQVDTVASIVQKQDGDFLIMSERVPRLSPQMRFVARSHPTERWRPRAPPHAV
jgi:hypothetical protein